MPRRFFINNLNTYIGQALLNELRNDTPDNEDPNVILGSYTDRDSSEKIPGTKKMLKVFLKRDANRDYQGNICLSVIYLYMIYIMLILKILRKD